jgi:hypothetical protein
MQSRYLYFALGLLAGCIVGVFGNALLRYGETYDQCMLDAMKGQPSQMYASAYAVCRARHPDN